MKSSYYFWYGLKGGREYLLATVICKKPNMTKASKTLHKLMSFDDEVDRFGWTLVEPDKPQYRLKSLIPHEQRQK